jgi:hypothetical protein
MARPQPDAALAEEMSASAELAQALDERLDLSVSSIAVVDDTIERRRLGSVDIYLLGAYVGEVLHKAEPTLDWAANPRPPNDPVLALGIWAVDPFRIVDTHARRKAHPDSTLAKVVADILAYGSAPYEETATALGWTTGWSNGSAIGDLKQLRRLRRARRTANASRGDT